ncbi:unnamed protein product, partial [Mesorhabditis spiculigera]
MQLLVLKMTTDTMAALQRADEPPADDQDELQKREQAAELDIGQLEAKLLEINQLLASDDLSPEQRKELEKTKADTENYLDKLRRLKDALLDKLANLTKYGQEKQKLNSAAEPVEVALNTIFDKYANQAPQPFLVGKDDLSRADEVKAQLADLARAVVATKEWLHDNLPSREADLDAQLDDLKWKQENLNSLIDELATEVQAGDAIRANYDQLLPLVADIENRAMAARQTGDLSDPAALNALKSELEPLIARVAELKRMQAEKPPRLTGQPESVDADRLTDRLRNVDNLLNDEEKNVQAKLELLALANDVVAQAQAIDQVLARAHEVEGNPNASVDELRKAADQLEQGRPLLDALNNDYEKIKALGEAETPEGQKLAVATLERFEKATEAINTANIALQDRADALEDLHKKADGAGSRLAELVDEANRLVRDPEALPSSYEPTAGEMREQLSIARKLLASARDQDEHTASLATTIDAVEALLPVLDDRTTYWNEFVAALDNADQLLENIGAQLDALQAKQPEHLAAAKADLEEAKRLKGQDVERLKEAARELHRLSELLDPLESAYADARFLDADIDQKVAHIDNYMADLAEIEDELVGVDSAKKLAEELHRLLADIPQINDVDSWTAIAEHEIPALKAQLDLLKDKMAKANDTRHRVLAESPVYPLEEKLNAVEAALDKAKQNANEADNERLLLVLNLQLEQVEQLPLDNVSVEQLDAIEKQLESLKPAGADQVPPQVQAQLDKIAELKARKDKHDADVAQLGAALDDIRKNLNEADKLAHPTKKGKKGKEQAVAPTTDALKEVVAKLENEVLPALAQVNNQAASTPGVEPQLQAANELQAKAQELLADAQKRLDDQMAADEKAARVEAKLLEIMVTPDGIGASKSTAEPPHFHQGKLHNIICSKTLISGDSNEDFKQNLKRLEHAKCFNPKRGSISDLAIANVLLRGPAGAWNSPASNEKTLKSEAEGAELGNRISLTRKCEECGFHMTFDSSSAAMIAER